MPPPGYTPYPPPYPPGGWPASRAPSGLAIASMVVGIVGICMYPLGVPAGIVAIILGIVALRKIKADDSISGDGFAWAGIVTGAVGMLIGAAMAAFIIAGISGAFDDWPDADESDEVVAIEVKASATNANEDRFNEVEVLLTAHDAAGGAVTYHGTVEIQLTRQDGARSWTMINETAYTVTPSDLGSWNPVLRITMENRVGENDVFQVQAKLTLEDGRVFEDFSPPFDENGRV